MAFQRGVPEGARGRRRDSLAVVVVELREARGTGQQDQHQQGERQDLAEGDAAAPLQAKVLADDHGGVAQHRVGGEVRQRAPPRGAR